MNEIENEIGRIALSRVRWDELCARLRDMQTRAMLTGTTIELHVQTRIPLLNSHWKVEWADAR